MQIALGSMHACSLFHALRHAQSQVHGNQACASSIWLHHGCFMISGMVMRFRGSTTKMRLSRSVTSLDRASRLSRMKGDSLHVLFTSCNLHSVR